MARYIDADALMQELKDKQSKGGTLDDYEIGYWNGLTMAQAIVLSQPTADVVEVKHGRWLLRSGYYYCSECSARVDDTSKYCPDCGAKMNGKDDVNVSCEKV